MIICIGESLVDIVDGAACPGGSAFNSALAASRLDGPAIYVGALSSDQWGSMLMQRLIESCVIFDPDLVNRPEPTMKAFARIDANGSASYEFEFKGSAATVLSQKEILDSISLVENTDFTLFGSVGILIQPSIVEAVKELSKVSFVMFDPNVRPAFIDDWDSYRALFRELCSISDIVRLSDEDLRYIGMKASEVLACCKNSLIITDKDGADWLFKDGRALHSSSPKVEVVDTIGCGDAFSAAVLVRLQERLDGEEVSDQEILDFASRAASLNCTAKGACCPLRSQM